jgi:hypothetical protein
LQIISEKRIGVPRQAPPVGYSIILKTPKRREY